MTTLPRGTKALLLLSTAAVVVAFAACRGASGPSGGLDCNAACENLARARCGLAQADCEIECVATLLASSADSFCKESFETYVACLATLEEPACSGGSIDRAGCRDEWDRYRNGCLSAVQLDEPCAALPESWNVYCGQASPMVCRGEVPANCRPGGGGSFPDLYCCGDELETPDGGFPDGGGADGGNPDEPDEPDGGTPWDGGSALPEEFRPMVRACLYGLGCGSYGMETNSVTPVSACVENLWERRDETETAPVVPTSRAIGCGTSGVTDCNLFATCMTLAHGGDFTGDWCDSHPGTTCDGNLLVTCREPNTTSVVDCAAGGNSCQVVLGEAKCLSRTDCSQTGSYCAGDQAWAYCLKDGRETTYGCQPDERCRTITGAGAAQCYPATACSNPGTKRCDGSVLRECRTIDGVQSFEWPVDCAARGQTCFQADSSNASCRSLSPACTQDRCDGNEFVVCAFGRELRQSCMQLGFSTCGPTANGPIGCL